MVPWWSLPIVFVSGVAIGFVLIALLSANDDDDEEE